MPSASTITRTAVPLLALSISLFAQEDSRPGWNDTPTSQAPQLPVQYRDNILTLRTGVQLVVQDITVLDATGHPVLGLKPEDFHITEDGRPQTIKNFEEHAPIDPALAAERAAALAHALPPNTFTNYKAFSGGTVVVFLLQGMQCAHLTEGMMDYMKDVPAGTPFIIFRLDLGLHMLQDMTTDRETLEAAAQANNKYVEAPVSLGPEDARFPAYVIAQKKRQILTAATRELSRYLAAIPGRKNLVWFGSPGGLSMIDEASLAGIPTDMSIDPATLNPVYSNPNSSAGLWDPKAMPPPTEMKAYPTLHAYLDNITDNLAQSRIAWHIMQGTCDPFYPVKQGIAAVVDNGAHYYTLSYTPTNNNWNGQPRRFRVELADQTLRLEYRKSYRATLEDKAVQHIATPVETAAATTVLHEAAGQSPTMQTAMGMGTVEPTQIVFEATASRPATETKDTGKEPPAGNFLSVKLRKQGYRNYTIHYRVRANELKLTPTPDQAAYTGKLEFVAVVYDNQGQAVNGKRQKASITFANLTDPQLQTAELTGDLTVEVPAKGSYFLRLGVRDTATDRVGALEIPVDRIAPASATPKLASTEERR